MIIKCSHQINLYNLKECRLLGEGHNGTVYMLPNGDAIKISYNKKHFIAEYQISEKVNGNKYFPIVREIGVDYMIRECIH
jgi:predicted Ser/Thr protein kinase